MYEIKGVTYSYKNQKTKIHPVYMTIKKGEFVLLAGISGCGKTTFLRCLNGLIPDFYEGIYSGDVLLDGISLRDFKRGMLAEKIGNVFQDPRSQFFSTNVADEVALIGQNLGMDQKILIERVDAALRYVGMQSYRDCNIRLLSGGQKQKIAIASALVYDSSVIILDEPSANLDYASTIELKEILMRLKHDGKTIIIAEHRLFYLKDAIDKMIFMNYGHIENIYSAAEILSLSFSEMGLRALDFKHLKAELSPINTPDKIVVRNLCVGIKNKILIPQLSFCIKEREILGIIGQNGIGKTTLAKILCGLLPIKHGTISLGKKSTERLKKTYYVMQDPDMQLFYESVEKEILAGQNKQSKTKNELKENIQKASDLLQKLDLWDKRFSLPQELSTGEKQRLCVATACMQKRDLLIFDEPTSGLDLKRMQAISYILKEQAKKIPIVVITHDFEFILKTCNRVLLLKTDGCESLDIMGNEKELLMIFEKMKKN